jgi:hypothetical protein
MRGTDVDDQPLDRLQHVDGIGEGSGRSKEDLALDTVSPGDAVFREDGIAAAEAGHLAGKKHA